MKEAYAFFHQNNPRDEIYFCKIKASVKWNKEKEKIA
jgi:hypothetical protein